MIKDVDGFRVEDFRIVDLPFRINDERGHIQSLPPLLGEHTEEVLRALNLTEEQIAHLQQETVAR